jgi:hypothetical protein
MSVKDWFRNTYGKFSGEEGGVVLECYLLRREIALAQLDLLKKRRKAAALEHASAAEYLAVLIAERKKAA